MGGSSIPMMSTAEHDNAWLSMTAPLPRGPACPGEQLMLDLLPNTLMPIAEQLLGQVHAWRASHGTLVIHHPLSTVMIFAPGT